MQTPPPPPQGPRTGQQIDEAVDSTDSEEMEEEQDEEQEVPPQLEPSASSKPQDEVKIQDGPEEMVQGSASPLGLRRSPEEGPVSTEALQPARLYKRPESFAPNPTILGLSAQGILIRFLHYL